ncbi:MAG: PaaI family thioesterase [Eubacterium sp.]|nr:PaaI family thioesterase [Eubacterium sp.]
MTEDSRNELFELAKAIQKDNAFAIHNGIKLKSVEKDQAEVYLDITADSLNHSGNVHGGAFLSLADVCSGCAARTDGRKYVTQAASACFVRGAKEGRITARGSVLHRGRKNCLIRVDVIDDNDKMLFYGTYTYYCVSE